jgi:integrase
MSIYRGARSPYYQYDFQVRGYRFYGSTKCTSRREAEIIERQKREQAKQQVADGRRASTSLRLDDIADRYWLEVGQYHSNANNTERDLARLVGYLGKDNLITEITDDDVTRLVAWRRGHRVIRSKKAKSEDCPLISNATVNRSTTEVLKKLFTRAKLWKIAFRDEPDWKRHKLKEAPERVRELHDAEAERIDKAMRADYAPLFEFAHATGLRQREATLLRWSEVNWQTREIVKLGKGGKKISVKITPTIREILWPLQGHHPEFVFTYVAARTRGERIKGARYPVTVSGLKTRWRRTRKAAGVTDFRFHDYRHDFATKLLRETGNLKLVSRALHHCDLKTTLRYAHVLDDEIADAIESIAKSRKRSRTGPRNVG